MIGEREITSAVTKGTMHLGRWYLLHHQRHVLC